ncbi:hypothetical protein BN2497_13171 [Janthinobacterium sp. CG23_2]|nr:hypothetical protein BN2497_13171 [Janthinobacterium sp. CG23_2]CUU32983.1 hypothetical protein BN3177_13171 [Janthinobacterium sp. CG23_2]
MCNGKVPQIGVLTNFAVLRRTPTVCFWLRLIATDVISDFPGRHCWTAKAGWPVKRRRRLVELSVEVI